MTHSHIIALGHGGIMSFLHALTVIMVFVFSRTSGARREAETPARGQRALEV